MKKIILSQLLLHTFCAVFAITFTRKADLPASSRNFGMSFCIDGKGYYGLGHKQTKPFIYKSYNDLWEYNPEKDTWTQKAEFPGPGRLMARGFSVNGKIYAGFGYVIAASGPNAGGYDYQTDLYEFDPAQNKWSKKNDALLGRGDIFFVLNGKVHAVNPEFRAVNTYNPTTDSWFENKWEKGSLSPDATTFIGENISFSCGGKKYFICTQGKKKKRANHLWELEPSHLSWKDLGPLPGQGNEVVQAFDLSGRCFVTRGGTELLEFVPASGTWNTVAQLPAEHANYYHCFSIEQKCYGISNYQFWELTP